MKKGHLRRHTSTLKPLLTEENKVARVRYALDEVDGATLGGDGVVAQFKNMYNHVDIDKKWFYQTTDGKNYILSASEDDAEDAGDCEAKPNRTIQHKNHIPKVMFLCAQAQPRYDTHRNGMWDGKIGL
jgi:hypothetical protein